MTSVTVAEVAVTFDAFYAANFSSCVARTARQLGGDLAAAEDIVQEAMMSLYGSWAEVDNKTGWLATTCQRKVWKHWHDRPRNPLLSLDGVEQPDPGAGPADTATQRDQLRRLLEELYPEEITIFQSLADGDALIQIANAQSSTVPRIRSTISQARRRLNIVPADTAATGGEILERYHSLLPRLPRRQRQVVKLALAGVKPAGIASRLGISANTARVNLYHGKQALAQMPSAPPPHVLDALITTWRDRVSVPQLRNPALAGHQQAWSQLIEDYQQLVWSVARAFGLSEEDAADVSQAVWMRLLENLDRIEDSKRIAGWLAVTARREAMRMLRAAQRETPEAGGLIEEAMELAGPDAEGHSDTVDPELIAIAEQDRRDLWAAFSSLSTREQQLLKVVSVTPMNSYMEVAKTLGMAVGSIGPARARALEHLKRALAAQRREREAF